MRLVTAQDAEVHNQKIHFLKKFFPKTFSSEGLDGFFSISHPPHGPIDLGEYLSSRYFYNGRFFKPENRWYFAKEYLKSYDLQESITIVPRVSELSMIENIYHSELETFVISSKADFRIERLTKGLLFAGYPILNLNGLELREASDKVKILNMETSINSRSVVIHSKSSIMIHLPTALVNEYPYQGMMKYKLNMSRISFRHEDEKWRITKPTEG